MDEIDVYCVSCKRRRTCIEKSVFEFVMGYERRTDRCYFWLDSSDTSDHEVSPSKVE